MAVSFIRARRAVTCRILGLVAALGLTIACTVPDPPKPMTFRDICRFYAPTVKAPDGVDAYALLYAIGMAESSGGTFNITRYEKSYHSGRYAVPALIEKFGAAAACSYGPWQIMYPNAVTVLGYDIDPLRLHIPEVAAVASVRWLNEHVIRRGVVTVRDIADAWNTGNPRDNNVPHVYIAKVQRWYDEALDTRR